MKYNKNEEKDIFDYLSANLSEKRYNHTIAVNKLAIQLAKVYELDINKVSIASLLHDCAKDISFVDMKKYILKNNIKIKNFDFVIRYLPQILHSYIGADIAQKKFGIKDKYILNSIKNHTVGRIGMSDYEKVVFIADSLSEDRKYKKKFVSKKIMYNDLNKTFKLVLQNKINYLVSAFKVLHPDMVKIWNWYNK